MTKYQTLISGNKSLSNYYTLFLLVGLVLTIITLFPRVIAAQADEHEKWLGSYMFDDKAQVAKRRNSYDVVPVAAYDINIEEGADGKLTAIFSANGVQLFEAYECSVKMVDNKIKFYYERFGAPGVKDLRKFKKGDLLFTLVETQVDKTTKYLFQPVAYKILRYNKNRQKENIYFEKQ